MLGFSSGAKAAQGMAGRAARRSSKAFERSIRRYESKS